MGDYRGMLSFTISWTFAAFALYSTSYALCHDRSLRRTKPSGGGGGPWSRTRKNGVAIRSLATWLGRHNYVPDFLQHIDFERCKTSDQSQTAN